MSDYFYDSQIRRYMVQFMRIFSDLKYRTDPDENGFMIESRVPIKYGDMSRMVASIISGNTENATPPVPSMSAYITGLKMDDERRHDPTFTSSVQVNELKKNDTDDGYTSEIGNRYTVERYMPVPYTLSMKLDILTSNTHTKLQLLEQILTIFNPMLELQQNENPLDWSRVFQVLLKNTTWSNRSIPIGTNVDYDIVSLDFDLNIWINPPAKEKRQRIISNIITRVFDSNDSWDYSESDIMAQLNVTSSNLKLSVTYDNGLSIYSGQLLPFSGTVDQGINWESKMKEIGTIVPNVTKIKLRMSDDLDDESGDIYGTITEIDTNDNTIIHFTIDIDTLPSVIAISPVTKFIDPKYTYPGNGIDVNDTSVKRFVLLGSEDSNDNVITTTNSYWDGFTAKNNDIIEYISGNWEIVFDSSNSVANQYIINVDDGNHYRFDGEDWVYTLLGVFNPTYWSLIDIQN